MPKLVVGLEPQFDFPHSDITEDNARMLAVMLGNADMLKMFHESAESVSRLFTLGHTAVIKAVDKLYDTDKVRAASIGAAVYEALAALIQTNPTDATIATITSIKLLPATRQDALSELLQDSITDFCSTMPRTAEVVEEVCIPLVASNAPYAMLGASVVRNFELTAA